MKNYENQDESCDHSKQSNCILLFYHGSKIDLKQRINEWSNRHTVPDNQQNTKEKYYNDYWRQPPFFTFF